MTETPSNPQNPKWISFALKDMLPDSVMDAINGAKDGAGYVVQAAEAVNYGLDIAKQFLQGLGPDLLKAVAEAVANFIQDLLNADVYYLPVWDFGLEQIMMFGSNTGLQEGAVGPDGVFKTQVRARSKDPWYKERMEAYFLNRYGLQPGDENDLNGLGYDSTRALYQAGNIDAATKLFLAGKLFDRSTPTLGSSVDRFVRKITDSFDDLGDDERPQYSANAEIVGITIMLAFPSGAEAIQAIQELLKLFNNLPELERILNNLRAILTNGLRCTAVPDWVKIIQGEVDCPDPNAIPVLSQHPNWQRGNLQDYFPPIKILFDLIEEGLLNIIAIISMAAMAPMALLYLIEVIQAKLNQIFEVLQRIEEYLRIIAILLAASGFYVVFVRSRDGVPGFQDLMRTADRSVIPFDEHNADAFCMGCTLLAGGPGIKPFELFFSALEDYELPET